LEQYHRKFGRFDRADYARQLADALEAGAENRGGLLNVRTPMRGFDDRWNKR
jgi:hypothetical protein